MKRLLYAAAAFVFLAALLALAAPRFVDTPAVRAEIQRRLAEALQGQVTWDALEIAVFPAPHGELRKVRVEIPGKLSAAAEAVDVYLRLWPLLRGQPEVSSIALKRPSIRILAGGGDGSDAFDAVALYRAALEPAARALQEFAPDMELTLDQASVEIERDFALRDLRATARSDGKGIAAKLAATSNLWKRLSVEARVEYADLSARASVALDALALDKEVPPAALRAKLRTDGKSVIECEFEGSVGSLVPAVRGQAQLPAGKPPQLVVELSDIDLAQAFAIARRKGAPLDALESAEGRLSAKAEVALSQDWLARIDIVKSDAAVKVAALPWKLSATAAHVALTEKQLHIAGAKGSLGESTFEKVAAQIDLGKTARVSAAAGSATLELEQWFTWLHSKLPLDDIAAVSGSAEVTLHRLALGFDNPAAVDFDAVATPRNVSASLKALPFPVAVTGGSVRAGRSRVLLAGLQGSLGSSTFMDVAAQIDLGKAARVSSGSGRASVELEQWFPWLKAKLPLEEISSVSGSANVALNRLALRFDDPAAADYDAVVTPRKVSAALKTLPAAVSVDGGAIQINSKNIRLDKVAAAMLDAHAEVSGTVVPKTQGLELALAQGIAGEKLVRWALERADVPARFEPRTPLRFAARRVAWAPKGALEADATIDFEGGPALALALAWRPERLELRRVTIKDARSDAVLGATIAGDLIQASFAGTLQGHSIPAMLRQPLPADSGTARGELRLTIDRKHPEQTAAEGKLRIEALDLSWLAGSKAVIERAELVAERTGMRVTDSRFGWKDQFFELRGTGRRTDQGPVVDARIESAGVLLDRLLPPPDPNAPRKKSSAIWPLPLAGRVEVRSGFVQHKDYRIEPFDGILHLEPRRARLEVKEARMCGVSFPMEVQAEPEHSSATAHIRIENEPLERTVRCLTGGDVELTGNADLKAELRIQGQRPHLVRGLTGTLEAEVRDGRVKKFALIGNVLAFRGLASLEDMKQDGFPYRRMTARGHFAGGEFRLEEGFFDSNAARLAASGRVDLLGANSQLSVLVAPLTTVERLVGAVPLLGDVFGGTMVALPVAVSGDIRSPYVVPLGPRAISDQLLGIFERTLKLPGKLVVPPETKQP